MASKIVKLNSNPNRENWKYNRQILLKRLNEKAEVIILKTDFLYNYISLRN